MKPLALGELFALPLQSAVRAQNLALQETLSIIEQVGLEDGAVRTIRFTAERIVEERTLDPETGEPKTEFVPRPFEVSIPILAILTPPAMQLQEMNVEFGIEVVEPRSEPIRSATIPSALLGRSLAPSLSVFTQVAASNPTTINVKMKIVREAPEGLARVVDLMTGLLSTQGPTAPGETTPPDREPGIEALGLSEQTTAFLKDRGIKTLRDFLAATETQAKVRELAGTLRVAQALVRQWRTVAARLIDEAH